MLICERATWVWIRRCEWANTPINQLAIIFALIQLRNSFYSGRQEGAKSATLNTVITDSLITYTLLVKPLYELVLPCCHNESRLRIIPLSLSPSSETANKPRKKMAIWNPGGLAISSLAVFYRVRHDRLSERETTRSLPCRRHLDLLETSRDFYSKLRFVSCYA